MKRLETTDTLYKLMVWSSVENDYDKWWKSLHWRPLKDANQRKQIMDKIIEDNPECCFVIMTPTACTDKFLICLYRNVTEMLDETRLGENNIVVSGKSNHLPNAEMILFKRYYKQFVSPKAKKS